MYANTLLCINAALVLIATVGLWIHSRKILAGALFTSLAMMAFGLLYILTSSEAPGFTENLSTMYRFASYSLDLGRTIECLVVLIVCWSNASSQPNNALKALPPFAGTGEAGPLA